MTKYNLEDFKKWLDQPQNAKLKYFQGFNFEPSEGTPINWDSIINEIEGKDLDEYLEKKEHSLYQTVLTALSSWKHKIDRQDEDSDSKEEEKTNLELQKEMQALKKTFNQQLKELNILIDPQAEHYTEPIQFEGFKKHLSQELNKLKNNQLTPEEKELINWTIKTIENKLAGLDEDDLEAGEKVIKEIEQEAKRLELTNLSKYPNFVVIFKNEQVNFFERYSIVNILKDKLNQYRKLVELKATHQEVSNLTHQKLTSLETQLISLAKQKIKNQKQAKELLTQLETNWKAKETNWTKTEQDYQKQLATKEQALTNLELIRQQEQKELETELKHQKELLTQSQTNLQELKEEKEELTISLQLHHQKITDLETQLLSLSTQKITTQQTLTRTHQKLTQTQTHYQTRKTQALVIGIIGLALILYLSWPLLKQEELKAEPRTWI